MADQHYSVTHKKWVCRSAEKHLQILIVSWYSVKVPCFLILYQNTFGHAKNMSCNLFLCFKVFHRNYTTKWGLFLLKGYKTMRL